MMLIVSRWKTYAKQEILETLPVTTKNCFNYLHYELSFFQHFWHLKNHIPITNAKISSWKAILPAVLIVLSVENLLFMLFRRNVTLPLLLTITVLPTHPTVKIHLFYREFEIKTLKIQHCKHRTAPNTFWMFSLCWPVNALPKQIQIFGQSPEQIQMFRQSPEVSDLHRL